MVQLLHIQTFIPALYTRIIQVFLLWIVNGEGGKSIESYAHYICEDAVDHHALLPLVMLCQFVDFKTHALSSWRKQQGALNESCVCVFVCAPVCLHRSPLYMIMI